MMMICSDCGGEITLSSTNTQVTFTSPNFPNAYGVNRECNWLIKVRQNFFLMFLFQPNFYTRLLC
jgi:hypothetical protein